MTPHIPAQEITPLLDACSFETHELAIEYFQDSLFHQPRNADAHLELAKVYRAEERMNEAREHEAAAEAIRKHPVEVAAPRSTPALRKGGTKLKAKAMAIAVAAHGIFLLLLALWLIEIDRAGDPPMQVFTTAGTEAAHPSADLLRSLRQKPRRISQVTPALTMVTVDTPLPISLPQEETVEIQHEIFSSFGAPLTTDSAIANRSSSRAGSVGTVEFFGIRSKAERMVFIVDFSTSMQKGRRLPRLKKELNEALSSMPDGMLYNIIYYSDNAWLAETRSGGLHQRHLPEKARWIVANRDAKQLSAREIAWMKAKGSTFWAPPLRLALSMDPKPDLIWLLSDGDAADRKSLVRKIDRMVGDDIRINTIGLELGGVPFQSLVDIAIKTGGTYSIIMAGTQHHGEAALRFTHPVYGQPEN